MNNKYKVIIPIRVEGEKKWTDDDKHELSFEIYAEDRYSAATALEEVIQKIIDNRGDMVKLLDKAGT